MQKDQIQACSSSHSLQIKRFIVQDHSFGLANQDTNLLKLQQLQNNGLLQVSQFDNKIPIQTLASSNQNQSRDNLKNIFVTTPTATIQSFGEPYLQTFNPQEQIISSLSAYPTDDSLGHMSWLNHQERYLHSQREIVPNGNTASSIDLKLIYQGKNTSSL